MAHFAVNNDISAPLFQRFLPALAAGLGISSGLDSEHVQKQIMERIPNHPAWSRMFKKIGMSRWFGWTEAAGAFLDHWDVRQLGYVWTAICANYRKLPEGGVL